TTGLDPQSRANLWEHIRTLRSDQGVTLFLTTHYLEEADALCDRILVIDGGEIVAEGTPDALKARVSGDSVVLGVDEDDMGRAAEIVGDIEAPTTWRPPTVRWGSGFHAATPHWLHYSGRSTPPASRRSRCSCSVGRWTTSS